MVILGRVEWYHVGCGNLNSKQFSFTHCLPAALEDRLEFPDGVVLLRDGPPTSQEVVSHLEAYEKWEMEVYTLVCLCPVHMTVFYPVAPVQALNPRVRAVLWGPDEKKPRTLPLTDRSRIRNSHHSDGRPPLPDGLGGPGLEGGGDPGGGEGGVLCGTEWHNVDPNVLDDWEISDDETAENTGRRSIIDVAPHPGP